MRRLILFAIGALTALAVGAAGAYFTAQAQVPENMIRAGSVAVSTEPTAAAISIDALAPGAVVTKPLTLVNDGNLPVSVTVTCAKKAGITEFYDALTCRVLSDGLAVYDGPMTAMKTSPVTLQPGTRSQLQFGVGLPATAGNTLAGGYVKVTLYVDSEQVK
jgi:predicted ribosomally synthesized peptide with SipW-like signal peptide